MAVTLKWTGVLLALAAVVATASGVVLPRPEPVAVVPVYVDDRRTECTASHVRGVTGLSLSCLARQPEFARYVQVQGADVVVHLPGGTTAVYRGAARVLVDVEEVPAILQGVVYGVVDDSALGEERGRVTLLTGDELWR